MTWYGLVEMRICDSMTVYSVCFTYVNSIPFFKLFITNLLLFVFYKRGHNVQNVKTRVGEISIRLHGPNEDILFNVPAFLL